jgi:hypothetical protein
MQAITSSVALGNAGGDLGFDGALGLVGAALTLTRSKQPPDKLYLSTL